MSARGDTLDLPESIRKVPVSDRLTGIFLERGRLDADAHCLRFVDAQCEVRIPVGLVAVIFLEPGTTVTHRAVQLAAVSGTLLLWVGEACGKVYSAGAPSAGQSHNLVRQATVVLDSSLRLSAAKRLFEQMFRQAVPDGVTRLEQLRGYEGARVKELYAGLASGSGVKWTGRRVTGELDPPNAALSHANAFLYGVVEAVILGMGYSPALGVVHHGDARSFVFDVADTVKFETVVPLAFELCAAGREDLANRVRRACRERFRAHNLLPRIAMNIDGILGK